MLLLIGCLSQHYLGILHVLTVAFESKIVIDATGHDSVAVKRLRERGLVEWKGMNPMWVEDGEDAVVNYTAEVFPGLIAVGML